MLIANVNLLHSRNFYDTIDQRSQHSESLAFSQFFKQTIFFRNVSPSFLKYFPLHSERSRSNLDAEFLHRANRCAARRKIVARNNAKLIHSQVGSECATRYKIDV